MDNFITSDDIWGIRKAVRYLWEKNAGSYHDWNNGNGLRQAIRKDICFDAFFNQQVPIAWRETLGTVKRHAGEIEDLASDPQHQGVVWYKRNGQINSGYLNLQLVAEIEKGDVVLPTYMEIEEEKQRWQSHPQYNKERGFSEPIKEELIQIRIQK